MHCCVVRAVSFVMVAGIVTIAPAMAADPVSTAKRKADAQRRKIEHQQRVAEIKRTQAPHRGQPLDAAAWALTALGFAVAAVRVLHTPNDAWDLAPLGRN